MKIINSKTYDSQYEKYNRLVSTDKLKCYYKKSMFNTLVEIKPRFCLEIGTNKGGTAEVFQNYFDKYEPNGLLVTCDIKKYVDLKHLKNVKQIIVAHHIRNISTYHDIKDNELKYDFSDSVSTNVKILKDINDAYDFAFIDGDHTKDSFLKDVKICETVLKDPKYMLIDDTKEPVHDCSNVYMNEIKTNVAAYECYDFDNWQQFVGCSLVLKKNF